MQLSGNILYFSYYSLNFLERVIQTGDSCYYKRSRHTVVCGAALKNGAHENYVSILTGATKLRFSRSHKSVIFYPMDAKVAV